MKNKFTVIGLGYVGTALATLLSTIYDVVAIDLDNEKVRLVNSGLSPISDELISHYFNEQDLNLKAYNNIDDNIADSDYIILATPTNFEEKTNKFDTSSIEEVLSKINEKNISGTIVIKSTVPIGYTDSIKKVFPNLKILFSPEFLREGQALYDNLYPSRIIVGGDSIEAKNFLEILKKLSLNTNVELLMTTCSEAEAIKLFSNSYLAMRVAFFNELDSFSLENNLNSKSIIEGVSLDDRIGSFYNNPSFGYGGYCLPKDTKQLLKNFGKVPQDIIQAIVNANLTRKSFIADHILKKNSKIVGIYRLIMKSGSDNYRESSIIDIAKLLINKGCEVIIYEPLITHSYLEGITIEKDLNNFKKNSDLIVTNRDFKDLNDVKHKVFTRDIFNNN